MHYPQFYQQGEWPIYSFEVFPPKTDKGMENLKALIPELLELGPRFMTVTYGALGTTRDKTLEIASLIRDRYGVETVSHLTCVASSKEELSEIVTRIYDMGLRNIVALRGDPPQGEASFERPANGFAHADELVAHIRHLEKERGWERFGIAVAGYPEKHLEAPDMASDLRFLKQKVEAGADCVVTQLFYENSRYYRFVEAAREAGITVPIIPGLLPILSTKQIKVITSMCGAHLPEELLGDLEQAQDDSEAVVEIGVRQCIRQARDLLDRGVPGIHFYVFNRSHHMREIMRELPATAPLSAKP